MCVILKDKHPSPTFAGCILDAQVWRNVAAKTDDSKAKSYLIAAAATVEHLSNFFEKKYNRGY